MQRSVWNDIVSWQTERLNNSTKYLLHALCKGNVSCTSYSRTFGYGKLRTSSRTTGTTWSTLRTMARTPQSTLTCTMRSSEHAAHRLLMHMCSHIALVAQGLALCVIPCHPCMRTCVLSLEWSLLTRLSTSSSSSSSSST